MAPVAIDSSALPPVDALADAHPLKAANRFKQSLNGLSDKPLQRTYRGNKEGTIHLEGIPEFDDLYAKRQWVKVRSFPH